MSTVFIHKLVVHRRVWVKRGMRGEMSIKDEDSNLSTEYEKVCEDRFLRERRNRVWQVKRTSRKWSCNWTQRKITVPTYSSTRTSVRIYICVLNLKIQCNLTLCPFNPFPSSLKWKVSKLKPYITNKKEEKGQKVINKILSKKRWDKVKACVLDRLI